MTEGNDKPSLAVVTDPPRLAKVEDADLYCYLFVTERVARVRAELAVFDRERVSVSAQLQAKYGLSDRDRIETDGKIVRG